MNNMKHIKKDYSLEEMDFDLDSAAIGGRIRIERKKLGMSQATLAEKIDISTTHMSHIETGSTKLSLATFVRLTECLNVLADTLLFPALAHDSRNITAKIVQDLNKCDSKELSIVGDIVDATVMSLKKNRI